MVLRELFLAAVSALTKRSKDFTSKQTSTFDFFGSEIDGLRKLYPNIPQSVFFAEAKIGTGSDLRNSMASKMHKFGAGTKKWCVEWQGYKRVYGNYKAPGLFQPKFMVANPPLAADKNNPISRTMLEKSMGGMKFAPAKPEVTFLILVTVLVGLFLAHPLRLHQATVRLIEEQSKSKTSMQSHKETQRMGQIKLLKHKEIY